MSPGRWVRMMLAVSVARVIVDLTRLKLVLSVTSLPSSSSFLRYFAYSAASLLPVCSAWVRPSSVRYLSSSPRP